MFRSLISIYSCWIFEGDTYFDLTTTSLLVVLTVDVALVAVKLDALDAVDTADADDTADAILPVLKALLGARSNVGLETSGVLGMLTDNEPLVAGLYGIKLKSGILTTEPNRRTV